MNLFSGILLGVVCLGVCVSSKSTGRQKRQTGPPGIVIDIAAVVDFALFERHGHDNDSMVQYVSAMFAEANAILSQLHLPGHGGLHLHLTGISIPQDLADSLDFGYVAETQLQNLPDAIQTHLPAVDAVVVFLSQNIYSTAENSTFIGYYIGGDLCGGPVPPILAVKATDLGHAQLIIRGLLNSMGIGPVPGECVGSFFLESSLVTHDQPRTFSNCTAEDIGNYIDFVLTNSSTAGECLFGELPPGGQSLFQPLDLDGTLPGEMFTPIELCGFLSADLCEPPTECGHVSCQDAEGCFPIQNPEGGHCTLRLGGQNVPGVCHAGKCIYEHDTDPTYYHCGRPGQECTMDGSGTCEYFVCTACADGYSGYDCMIPSVYMETDNSNDNCSCLEGDCYSYGDDYMCHCHKAFYGEKCDNRRYVAFSDGTLETIIMNVKGYFQGTLTLHNHGDSPACVLQYSPEMNYYTLTADLDAECPAAISEELNGRFVTVTVQYQSILLDRDEIVKLQIGNGPVATVEVTSGGITSTSLSLVEPTITVGSSEPPPVLADQVHTSFTNMDGETIFQVDLGDQVTLHYNPVGVYGHVLVENLKAVEVGGSGEQVLITNGCPLDSPVVGYILDGNEFVYAGSASLTFNVFYLGESSPDMEFVADVTFCTEEYSSNCAPYDCSLQVSRRKRSVTETQTSITKRASGDNQQKGVLESQPQGSTYSSGQTTTILRISDTFSRIKGVSRPEAIPEDETSACEESSMKIAVFVMVPFVLIMLGVSIALLVIIIRGRNKGEEQDKS